MAPPQQTLSDNEGHFESEKNFDATAYAAQIMKTVGADFHEDDPLFQSNEFRMHCYKILPCTKHFCHDWSVCPFAHFSERAKRRDPKEVKYTAIACPDMKKGENCPRGDRCPYSHNTFEYWLHPTRYRTRICRDGESCNRKICFFAHKSEEVRVPSARPSLPVAEDLWSTGGDDFRTKEKQTSKVFTEDLGSSTNGLETQFQAFLNSANSIRGRPTPANQEPTFVDQVFNGLISSKAAERNFPELSFSNNQTPQQFAHHPIGQNLCFEDSCAQALGFSPVSTTTDQHLALDSTNSQLFHSLTNESTNQIDPMVNYCLPLGGGHQPSFLDPFSSTGLLQSPLPYSAPTGACDFPSLTTNNGHSSIPVKPMDQYTEMLKLLSNLQMANSPTSVLCQGGGVGLGLNALQSVSVDGGSSVSGKSGTGIIDNEFEQSSGFSGGGLSNNTLVANSGPPGYFGMTLI